MPRRPVPPLLASPARCLAAAAQATSIPTGRSNHSNGAFAAHELHKWIYGVLEKQRAAFEDHHRLLLAEVDLRLGRVAGKDSHLPGAPGAHDTDTVGLVVQALSKVRQGKSPRCKSPCSDSEGPKKLDFLSPRETREKEQKQKTFAHVQRAATAFLKAKCWSRGTYDHDEHLDAQVSVVLEPAWRTKLRAFVDSGMFNMLSFAMISLNALAMMVQIEIVGADAGEAVGVQGGKTWGALPTVLVLLEYAFTVIFFTEVVFRFAAEGTKILKDVSFVLDAVVVGISLAELLPFVQLPNLAVLRLLRLAKLTRLLKAVKVMKSCGPLRVLIATISGCVVTLLWSLLIVGLIVLIGAIFAAQLLQPWIIDESQPDDVRLHAYTYFGTFARASLSMFEITIALGAWSKIARPLIEEVSPMLGFFFVAYVFGVTFAIMRIVTAIFLKETLKAAQADDEMMVRRQLEREGDYVDELRSLFMEADEDGSGMVSANEFEALLQKPDVKKRLGKLKLKPNQMSGLFRLLNSGDGDTSLDEFIIGVTQLKHEEKSVGSMTLLYESQKVMRCLQRLEYKLGLVHDIIEED